jgi:hypothetical protein
MIEFQGVTGDLPKVDSYLTEVPIQNTVPWKGWSVPPNGGGGGPNDKPLGGHHGGPLNGPPSGHLGGPPNGPPNEHSTKPFIDLTSIHSGGIPSGPLSKALNKPPSGPATCPYLGPDGYLIVVTFQWAHGWDILGDLEYQFGIQH